MKLVTKASTSTYFNNLGSPTHLANMSLFLYKNKNSLVKLKAGMVNNRGRVYAGQYGLGEKGASARKGRLQPRVKTSNDLPVIRKLAHA